MPRKCLPGCECGRHKDRGHKCPEGCTCKRHGYRCEDGCTCYRHHGAVYSTTSYDANHRRVAAERGLAREKVCAQCDGGAREWAQVHGHDGSNPWTDFIPLCNKCHRAYDLISERLTGREIGPETRAKLSAARIGKSMSPETRMKISASGKGRVVSDATRARLSASLRGRTITPEWRARISAAKRGRGRTTSGSSGA